MTSKSLDAAHTAAAGGPGYTQFMLTEPVFLSWADFPHPCGPRNAQVIPGMLAGCKDATQISGRALEHPTSWEDLT